MTDKIQPLSDDEVAEIEASYTPRDFTPERDKRHLKLLHKLRRKWIEDMPADAEQVRKAIEKARR